ncbi:Vacuolar protein sorting-associated protein 27 [Glycine soja]
MSTAEAPPSFQEAARCVVCNCSFNTFRRRHHCRSCGRTLCNEHSSNQMALPQFGLYSNVRVCADCFNNLRSGKDEPQTSSDGVNSVTDTISKLDINANVDSKSILTAETKLLSGIKECKCGMPLCICEAPTPSSDAFPQQKPNPVIAAPSNPKPKKTDTVPKIRSSISTSKFSSMFNVGHVTNGTSDRPQIDYEVTGEGLREAIKNSDVAAVKKLLNEGVDANYRDKQGLRNTFRLCTSYLAIQNAKEDGGRWSSGPKHLNNLLRLSVFFLCSPPKESFKYYHCLKLLCYQNKKFRLLYNCDRGVQFILAD